MAARVITYVWKIKRPNNEGIARSLMAAAYNTAIKTDPNTTSVLIRSVKATFLPPFFPQRTDEQSDLTFTSLQRPAVTTDQIIHT
jgi:hypothetical protein